MKFFLVPASKENIQKTISKEVLLSTAERFIAPFEFKELKGLLGDKKGFNCWAVSESRRSLFAEMKAEDIVLFTIKGTGKFELIGEIFYKITCKELGEYLWPYVPGEPWSFIYFIRNIKEIDVDKKNFIEDLGYDKNYDVPGAIKVNEYNFQRLKDIFREGKYNELRDYIDKGEIYKIEVLKKETEEFFTEPKEIEKIKFDILRLKENSGNTERAHEDLVIKFLQYLGYTTYTEITFQQGRIDINVRLNNEQLFVIEVKKDWNLSRGEQKIVQQAYNYAWQTGSRYAAITNGDYYSFYDLNKGRGYENNFIGELRITKLKEADLKFIESLKKDNYSNNEEESKNS